LESTTLLKLVLQALVGVALILVAILDYKLFDKRTKRFRLARRTLFILLTALLILNFFLVYEEDHSKRREIKQLTEQIKRADDSAATRNLELSIQIEIIRNTLETFMRKAKTKPPDIAVKNDLNKMMMSVDALKAEVQKKDISPVYIDVNPNRAGAEIFVDEVFKGAAPCSILVESGVHNLKVIYSDRSTGYIWQHKKKIDVSGPLTLQLTSNDFLKTRLEEE
jgi:hypothetical protein